MPIVSGALIPNSPLLLPKLSLATQKQVAKTSQAASRLAHELYARSPSVILIISGSATETDYSLLQSSQLAYSFAAWGDVVTSGQVRLATGFSHALKELAEDSLSVKLRSLPELPINFALPTVLLNQVIKEVPFAFLSLPVKSELESLDRLSRLWAEFCQTSSERIVLIAAGNLGQQAKDNNDATIYDKHFLAALAADDMGSLINIDGALRQQVADSLWLPTVFLRRVLAENEVGVEILSYEAPAGVGYLVALLNFK